MSIDRPAWSAAFAPDRLATVRRIPPIDTVTSSWAWGDSTGAGVKVAVIDSGIDQGHPAIGRPLSADVAIEISEDGLTTREGPHDDALGHGTACAGIIRALAPDCDLYSVKVLGAAGGRGANFIGGLRWAVEQGVQICNLSLGTTRSEFYAALHEIADLAYFRNVAIVAAANNLPRPSFPSMFGTVFSVAAHEHPAPELLYYNPEPPVEFGAPGINVRVAWAEGSWITATGNSFAAPHVSGLLARILGKHPGLTTFQLKTILRAVAANTTDP